MTNDFESKLNKYSASLAADEQAKKRMWNQISEGISPWKNPADKSFFIISIMKSFFKKQHLTIMMSVFAVIICLIVSVPFFAGEVSFTKKSSVDEKANVNIKIPEEPEPENSNKPTEEISKIQPGEVAQGTPSKPSFSAAPLGSREKTIEEKDKNFRATDGMTFSTNSKDEDTKTPENERAKEKSGTMTLGVDNVREKFTQVQSLVSEYDGFTRSSILNDYGNALATIEVRIPVEKFDSFLVRLREMSIEVISENISITDRQSEVTQYSSEIDRLQKLIDDQKALLEKTTDESQKLKIKSQIGQYENEKKINEQGLSSVREKTDYSTLSITLQERESKQSKLSGTWDDVTTSASDIIVFWLQVFMWLLVPAVLCTPLLLVTLVPGYLIRKKAKSKKSSSYAKASEDKKVKK